MPDKPNSSSPSNPLLPEIRTFTPQDWLFTKTYRRNLPHWELPGSTYFITARVVDSLSKPFLNLNLAMAMVNHLKESDKKKYILQAYVVMPDHFHLIIKPLQGHKLSRIMHEIKGGSSYCLNRLMNRKGQFWQKESFDHLIRDRISLRDKWNYIRDNPITAHLVTRAEDYPFSNFYRPSKKSLTETMEIQADG